MWDRHQPWQRSACQHRLESDAFRGISHGLADLKLSCSIDAGVLSSSQGTVIKFMVTDNTITNGRAALAVLTSPCKSLNYLNSSQINKSRQHQKCMEVALSFPKGNLHKQPFTSYHLAEDIAAQRTPISLQGRTTAKWHQAHNHWQCKRHAEVVDWQPGPGQGPWRFLITSDACLLGPRRSCLKMINSPCKQLTNARQLPGS